VEVNSVESYLGRGLKTLRTPPQPSKFLFKLKLVTLLKGDAALTSLIEGLRRLAEEAEPYLDLMKTEGGDVRIAVTLTDSGEGAALVVGDGITVAEEQGEPDIRLTMEKRVFEGILRGGADFGALIGRSKMSDVRPINFELLNMERAAVASEVLKAMMTFFFTPGRVKVKALRPELAGEAHGAHPIPLVYWDGVRFAWYAVRAGEVLNEEGERDPYPQAFVILRGRGVFVIDDARLELRRNTVIYVPPNSVHQIRADEDVEAIWIAWRAPPM